MPLLFYNLLMEKFEVTILGCGSALPTLKHYPSSQVVNIREKLFMVDCGEGTQLQLRKSRVRFNKLQAVFISHLHGDHCFGLIGMISTFALLGRTADLHIYAHKELEPVLNDLLAYFCKGISYKVVFHQVDTTCFQPVYEDRSVTIYSVPLRHRIPCCGYLFEEKPTLPHIRRDMIDFYRIPVYAINNIKNGQDWTMEDGTVIPNARLTLPADKSRKYAYCSDTMYFPEITNYLHNVDLLYHEATYGSEYEAQAIQRFHSTAAQAAKVARDSDVRKLMIGHYSARYEDETPLLKEAQAVFPHTMLAKELMTVSV